MSPSWWYETGAALPLDLGYFLAEPASPMACGVGGAYTGVDRLFVPPFPFAKDAGERGEFLPRLVERYWEEEDAVRTDYEVAARYCRTFLEAGVRVDLIRAVVAVVPDSIKLYPRGDAWPHSISEGLAVSRALQARLADRAPSVSDIPLVGYDVSLPIPTFHSALVNPGYPFLTEYMGFVNEYGLLTERRWAIDLMHEANLMGYSDAPFCVLAIYRHL